MPYFFAEKYFFEANCSMTILLLYYSDIKHPENIQITNQTLLLFLSSKTRFSLL